MSVDTDLAGGLGLSRDASQFVFLHDFFVAYMRRGPEVHHTQPEHTESKLVFSCMRNDGKISLVHDDGCQFRLAPVIRPLGIGSDVPPSSIDWLLRKVLHVKEPHSAVSSSLFKLLHQPMAMVLTGIVAYLEPAQSNTSRPS